MLVEFRQRHDAASEKDTAYALHHHHQICQSYNEALETLETMISAGYRYLQSRHKIVDWLLTTSSWTTVLPKRGEKFDAFVARAEAIGLANLSRRFAQLRSSMIEWSLTNIGHLTFGFGIFNSSEQPIRRAPESAAFEIVDEYETEWQNQYGLSGTTQESVIDNW